MVYDIVTTNAGNGYHAPTDVFIVPESGIYVFSSFTNADHSQHSTQFIVNNNDVGLIHACNNNGSITTGLAALHVNKGDDVYVKISSVSHTGTFSVIRLENDRSRGGSCIKIIS